LFDVFVVDGLVDGAALLDGPLAGAGDEPAGGVAGADEEPALVSFFSPTAVGDFSPSAGGFNLFE
jgi:hypothetical protein